MTSCHSTYNCRHFAMYDGSKNHKIMSCDMTCPYKMGSPYSIELAFLRLTINRRDFYYTFLCKIFALTCLKISYVQAETCSKHVKIIIWVKINLCCFRRNRCNVFSKKHDFMAFINMYICIILSTKWKVFIQGRKSPFSWNGF
jgi:hypothetical protein